MTKFHAETVSLFRLIRDARETPACCYYSDAFHAARAQLERSDNPAIRRAAMRLPVAYSEPRSA